MTEVHSPPNHLLRIREVYLFVSVDDAGNEGVCAAPVLGPGSVVPLVAADEDRLRLLFPWARQVAIVTGKRIRLLKLTTRTEVMEIDPEQAHTQ